MIAHHRAYSPVLSDREQGRDWDRVGHRGYGGGTACAVPSRAQAGGVHAVDVGLHSVHRWLQWFDRSIGTYVLWP